MTTYNWSIKKIKALPDYQGYQNVIKNVQWMLTVENNGSQKSIMGSCLLSDPGDNFIDYNLLTEDVVIVWVQTVLGIDKISRMKSALENSLLSGDSSAAEIVPLPWKQ